MKYYTRNLGDYARDAGHLSMAEHGALNLLMDRYYATEAPIADVDVYRVCRATSKADRDAVDAVLREFFDLEDGAWSSGRCEVDIEKTTAKASASRLNGSKGGRPPKGKGKSSDHPPCPQQAIIALYHEALPTLPPVNDWTDSNATALKNQWRKSAERQHLDWWRWLFEYIGNSAFLMGEKTDFQASLGWIVKPANFAKILNGNYENRERGQ